MRLPTGLIAVSVRALPAGELRQRYRRELIAELYGMSQGRQIRYAIGTVSTAWSLRNATSGREPMEATMTVVILKKPLRCRLGLHRWQTMSTPDGGTYLACSRCGKFSDPPVRLGLGA